MITLEAAGRPGTWRAMLKNIGPLAARPASRFTEREVQTRAPRSSADVESVQREATRPAREVLRQLNGDVTRGSRTMSATQTLALFQRLLPGITAREVSDAFTAAFDPRGAIFIAELARERRVPSEGGVLALGRGRRRVKPGKPPTSRGRPRCSPRCPRAGPWWRACRNAASGVTSMWLDNGVRVHHRHMDQRKNEASIEITLAGGQIQRRRRSRDHRGRPARWAGRPRPADDTQILDS